MSALALKQKELADYAEFLKVHPEWAEKHDKLHREIFNFNQRVNEVLNKNFTPSQFRSVLSILHSVPSGDLNFIFDTWLNELKNLGLLESENVN